MVIKLKTTWLKTAHMQRVFPTLQTGNSIEGLVAPLMWVGDQV